MLPKRVMFLVLLSFLGWVSWAQADPITQIVVFGDSLSDVGNVFAATGKPPPPYYQGHYSNGPIWVERLAADLGLPAPTPSLLGGTDYAFGGAETGTGFSPKGVPNVLTQIGAYLKAHKPASGQLFVVWAGANNFFDGQTNPMVPVADLGSAITVLAANGAKHILVPNYSNLANTPYAQSLPPTSKQGLSLLTQAYNGALSAELTQLQNSLGVHITQLDNYRRFQAIAGNPGAYGFSNVTTSALGDGVLSGNGYLFWDSVHPTTVGHQIIGDAAFAAVAPEPTSLALLTTGTLGVIVVAWRRRRKKGTRNPITTLALLLTLNLFLAPVVVCAQMDTERQVIETSAPMIPTPDSYPASPAPSSLQPTPWRLFHELKFDATWLPRGGSNGLGMTDLELATTLNVPLAEGWAPLMITPYAAAHFWAAPTGIGALGSTSLPASLYDMNVEFAWRPRLAQWLFADLAVTPGLYTDFKDVNGDSFQMRGRGLAIVAFSQELQLVAGGMYVNRNKTKFLPAGGVIWTPSQDTRCFLVFPQPKVSHRLTTIGVTEFWGYVTGEFGGGRWEIERANGVADSIDYTDLRVMLGIESVHAQRVKAHLEVGYVFARRVNFASDTPDYKPQDTVMLRAGFRF
jgi:phospholipase/lecithinase/hemolysin